jgi:hypothetical protein
MTDCCRSVESNSLLDVYTTDVFKIVSFILLMNQGSLRLMGLWSAIVSRIHREMITSYVASATVSGSLGR